ncbi:MAG: FAD-dependent oxidoreductase, partial [Cyanobacteria bacterium REEB65]|nr:FAD-dependent oxidoreductase [Cyanobacteria bacterium REEB65]
IRAFWEPLVLAAVNGPPEEVSAYVALQILVHGFLAGQRQSRLGFATSGLSDLFGTVEAYLTARGGQLLQGKEVASVAPEATGFWQVVLRGGERLEAEALIMAVPPWRLSRCFSGDLLNRAGLARGAALATAPIVSLQVVFDRPIVRHEVTALLDSPLHWVFAAGRIRKDAPSGALSLTASASRQLAAMAPEDVRELALAELERYWPHAREAKVLGCHVIKELDATIACEPGVEALRPVAATGVRGLFVAGAWTRTGLPGTIEGATISGLRAAEALEAERGMTCSLVQPLPEPSRLTRLLAGQLAIPPAIPRPLAPS